MRSSPLHRSRVIAMLGAVAWMAGVAGSCQAADNPPVDVLITDKGCEPNTLAVGAGKTLFKVKNASKRAIEWEILQGYMVVEERENIIPGFVQSLTATLAPGDYGMTCGLLSNPKGSLKVTAAVDGKS